jgi:Holliday junction resolvasome RuvABC endonuclease subunit
VVGDVVNTIVIGIDPGSGSSSACGLCAILPEAREIVAHRALWPVKYSQPAIRRVKDIAEQAALFIADVVRDYPNHVVVVGIESFVMRGKGGETLQRLIGAILTRVAYDYKIVEIQNTTMKKFVGGRGASPKSEVAEGVRKFFGPNPASWALATDLTERGEEDVIDALGIGIATMKKEGLV